MFGGKVNKYNILVVLTAALGSYTYGFTVNATGSVLGMASFYDYFRLDITSTTGVIGAIPGCYFAGGVIGAIGGAWTAEKFGRKLALFITSVIGVLGGAFLGAAVHVSMILIGRVLSGICAGGFQTIVPIYQSEVSPAGKRGSLVGQHGAFLAFGGACAVWAGLGCSFATNPQVQWRLAMSLSGVSPLVLGIAVFWLPESPRWLIARDRHAQGLQVLEKLHQAPGDDNNTLAREEYLQIRQQIDIESRNRTSIWESLKKKSMKKRMLIGFLVQFLLQSSGVLVIVTYQVILYATLGYTGWLAICLLAAWTSWASIGNFTNAMILDRFGRVPLLFWGLLGAIISLTLHTVMVARYAGTDNKVGCAFGVLFVYLYATFYAFCLDATSYVYCAEMFPSHMRTTGMAVSIVSYFAPALVYSQVAATAFATVGWKFFLVFIIVPACGLPVIWFYFPETNQLSLEEIAAVFGEEVALDITHMSTEQKEELNAKITKVDPIVAGNILETDNDKVQVTTIEQAA